jgi:AraC-like DNA-binding protein
VRFVEDVRVLVPPAGSALRVEHLPNGRTNLIVRVLDDGSGDVSVSGPRTRAVFKHATGIARAVVFQLRPGWSVPFLGVPANALTDRIVPLAAIWGRAGVELGRELLAARDVPEMLDLLARASASRHPCESSSARLARRAVRLLERDEVRVEAVAEQLGVSARHLRRAFAESVGIGPKEFVRTVRLQRAVRSAGTSTDWGRVAADAGYYDQAHLIADFRELVGFTPVAFVKQRQGVSARSSE